MDLDWLNPNVVVDILETASQLILQVYHGDDFFVESKSDNSPLTIADKKANDYICFNLKNNYPSIPIISEESVNDEYEKRKNYTFAWLVDPLDGTKEFIKRNGEFTVNIGLIYYGKPVAGFVSIPVSGYSYYAISGKGAWFREMGKEWISLKERRKGFIPGKLRVIASRSHINDETKDYIDKLGDIDMLNVGSSIKMLWVAENRADLYPRLTPCMEWDTCAAHSILLEVGGNIVSYPEGKELRYNKESLYNPFFVCQIDKEQ
jgi:3'(2'), 5'-bisphosphate nucleotidase